MFGDFMGSKSTDASKDLLIKDYIKNFKIEDFLKIRFTYDEVKIREFIHWFVNTFNDRFIYDFADPIYKEKFLIDSLEKAVDSEEVSLYRLSDSVFNELNSFIQKNRPISDDDVLDFMVKLFETISNENRDNYKLGIYRVCGWICYLNCDLIENECFFDFLKDFLNLYCPDISISSETKIPVEFAKKIKEKILEKGLSREDFSKFLVSSLGLGKNDDSDDLSIREEYGETQIKVKNAEPIIGEVSSTEPSDHDVGNGTPANYPESKPIDSVLRSLMNPKLRDYLFERVKDAALKVKYSEDFGVIKNEDFESLKKELNLVYMLFTTVNSNKVNFKVSDDTASSVKYYFTQNCSINVFFLLLYGLYKVDSMSESEKEEAILDVIL